MKIDLLEKASRLNKHICRYEKELQDLTDVKNQWAGDCFNITIKSLNAVSVPINIYRKDGIFLDIINESIKETNRILTELKSKFEKL